MYTPPHFEADISNQQSFVEAHPLATVVAQGAPGFLVNHIPLMLAKEDMLIGHIARANDLHNILQDGDPVLAVFQGVAGYISPNAYPSKATHHRHVPTWNYEVLHAHGTISFQHDTHSKRKVVALMTRIQERRRNVDAAWRMADAPADYIEEMLGNIVAFQISVARWDGKSKLSQNRAPQDALGAAEDVAQAGLTGLSGRMKATQTPD